MFQTLGLKVLQKTEIVDLWNLFSRFTFYAVSGTLTCCNCHFLHRPEKTVRVQSEKITKIIKYNKISFSKCLLFHTGQLAGCLTLTARISQLYLKQHWRFFFFRFVSVTMWKSSLPAVVRRRRTGGAPGRSLPGTAADFCGAARRWSRASLTACSRSIAAWCTSASASSAARTPEDEQDTASSCPNDERLRHCRQRAGGQAKSCPQSTSHSGLRTDSFSPTVSGDMQTSLWRQNVWVESSLCSLNSQQSVFFLSSSHFISILKCFTFAVFCVSLIAETNMLLFSSETHTRKWKRLKIHMRHWKIIFIAD